jgi:hypothetical protein
MNSAAGVMCSAAIAINAAAYSMTIVANLQAKP